MTEQPPVAGVNGSRRSRPARPGPVDAPAAAVGTRFAALEGYRGVAALAIVVYHVVQHAEGGRTAGEASAGSGVLHQLLHGLDGFVDLFFVLSAFLLALPYVRSALAGERSPSGRAFVVRRAARIVPLYVVAVLVVWSVRNPVLPGDLVDLVKHLTFTQVFDQQRIFWTIGPAWSLAVEVQFYLVLALAGAGLCVLCRRVRPGLRLPLVVGTVGAVALLSLAWKLVAWYVLAVPGDHWPTWFGLPAKLDVFALGVLLAVVVARGTVTVGAQGALVLRLLSGGVLLAAVLTRPLGEGEHVWFHTVVAVGFALLLASSVLGPQDRWVRTLSTRVLAVLGLVSYSLYLWHEPVLLAAADLGIIPAQGSPWLLPVGLAVVVPLSLLAAWVSYHVIERPAGHLRVLVDRRGRSRDYYDGS